MSKESGNRALTGDGDEEGRFLPPRTNSSIAAAPVQASQNRVRGKVHGDERLETEQRGRNGNHCSTAFTEELHGSTMAAGCLGGFELKQAQWVLARAAGG